MYAAARACIFGLKHCPNLGQSELFSFNTLVPSLYRPHEPDLTYVHPERNQWMRVDLLCQGVDQRPAVVPHVCTMLITGTRYEMS